MPIVKIDGKDCDFYLLSSEAKQQFGSHRQSGISARQPERYCQAATDEPARCGSGNCPSANATGHCTDSARGLCDYYKEQPAGNARSYRTTGRQLTDGPKKATRYLRVCFWGRPIPMRGPIR